LTDTKARIPDSKREKQRASAISFSFFASIIFQIFHPGIPSLAGEIGKKEKRRGKRQLPVILPLLLFPVLIRFPNT